MMEEKKFDISVGKSRTSKKWKRQAISWPDFVARCAEPVRTAETVEEYAGMTQDQRGTAKDVGGFVGGTLSGTQRKKNNVLARSMVTLDIDFCEGSALDFWAKVKANLSCAALVYASHSHTEKRPRLRLVVPLAKEVTTSQYEPAARKIAELLGINQFDDTTYQAARLMYWPSIPNDGAYFFKSKGGDFLDPREILEKYDNWRDAATWPHSTREEKITRTGIEKQGDPMKKPGIVGAFNRAYSIRDAIEILLADVYKEGTGGRYTFIEGESTNGLVIYDDVFAYSNHCTDPAHDTLCNAFDLVRIHKFGAQDTGTAQTEITRMPSYKAMCDFAQDDKRVKIVLTKDAAADFSNIDFEDENEQWRDKFEFDGKNNIKKTIDNFCLILDNDPALKGKIWFNELTQTTEADVLPWREKAGAWVDADDKDLRRYIQSNYGLHNPEMLYDAISSVSRQHKRHPIREYLNGLKWDGVARLETMIIDYIGADDTRLVRAVTRKHFAAAVARVFEPGIKYDFCLTLTGPEETGKSSLFRIMGGDWFDDSITTIEGKEGRENLRGKWLIELAELSGVKRSEVATIKNFLSNQVDSYRAAYERRVTQYPRQCVFCGTTNEDKFLKGDTGNRRFWVVEIKPDKVTRPGTLAARLDQLAAMRDQLWAEAVARYRAGECLYLDSELSKELRASQENFSDESDDPLKPLLESFLEKKLPPDWCTYDLRRRRAWINNPDPLDAEGTQERTEFCPAEFVCERMGIEMSDREYKYKARQVNKIMRALPEWEEVGKVNHVRTLYGRLRGYRKRDIFPEIDDADI